MIMNDAHVRPALTSFEVKPHFRFIEFRLSLRQALSGTTPYTVFYNRYRFFKTYGFKPWKDARLTNG
jgi:hypothetical protein